ncbi:MAG: aldehyde dehydrogenase family protein [Proteobacteria bacterium]|nr:aldehyde dehydrogenase family protein [Pseudomonadota bacterium]MCP4922147.1 aldehyde dehydrogenase family protein [Pseudomonadota bacterium]
MAWLEPIELDGRRGYRVRPPGGDETLREFPVATKADVAAAIARARQAAVSWNATPVRERVAIVDRAVEVLVENQEKYVDVISGETGRSTVETQFMSIFAACDAMNYYARRAASVLGDESVSLHLLKIKKATVAYHPLGVVGIITPWNGPFQLSMNPTVQALLAGNCVLLKPSEVTPGCGELVGEIFREAGLPEGVLQVLLGDGETGAALVSGGVDKISFTGSVATGRKIGAACGEQLIPCTLELGGKDPAVVLEDADLDRAVRGVTFAGLMNAGQFCAGTERVYVVESVADEFIDKLTEHMQGLRLGDDIGPCISQAQLAIVKRHVDGAVLDGAVLRCGGEVEGPYFQPTVLTQVTHEMAVMSEETFGPVLPVMIVDDAEHAVRMANDTRYGLGATVWTKNKARGEALARRIKAGSVCVNDSVITYGVLEVPFGGRGDSGVGAVNGAHALRGWSFAQPILTDRLGQKDEQHWYPYTQETADGLKKAIKVLWGSALRRLL